MPCVGIPLRPLVGLRAPVVLVAFMLAPIAGQAPPVFPGADWERVAKPESAGYLAGPPGRVARVAGLAGHDGDVRLGGRPRALRVRRREALELSRVGPQERPGDALRKYVEDGTIRLDRTLKDLQFTDVDGLLPRELEATIEHLITARSGVYHPASNAGDSTDSAPPRGSQEPGTYYLYNNWDFNAAGAVFEKLTGRDIYDVVESDLARPIGMQDFDRKVQRKTGDPQRSQHMAYHMHFSVRDMARIGLLMLREGNWNGQQVVPRAWAQKIRSLVTPMNEMNPPGYRALGTGQRWGYGYMWWVWDAPNSPGPFRGAYSGMGAGGQFITILPELDMVVAHKTDTSQVSPHGPGQRRRSVTGREYDAILRHADGREARVRARTVGAGTDGNASDRTRGRAPGDPESRSSFQRIIRPDWPIVTANERPAITACSVTDWPYRTRTVPPRSALIDRGLELPVPPADVHRIAAARAQAAHRAVRPRRRQRGQQVDLAALALQQHLGDPRGSAEVAVDLERRVGVEQVRVGAPALVLRLARTPARTAGACAACGRRGRRRAAAPRARSSTPWPSPCRRRRAVRATASPPPRAPACRSG